MSPSPQIYFSEFFLTRLTFYIFSWSCRSRWITLISRNQRNMLLLFFLPIFITWSHCRRVMSNFRTNSWKSFCCRFSSAYFFIFMIYVKRYCFQPKQINNTNDPIIYSDVYSSVLCGQEWLELAYFASRYDVVCVEIFPKLLRNYTTPVGEFLRYCWTKTGPAAILGVVAHSKLESTFWPSDRR